MRGDVIVSCRSGIDAVNRIINWITSFGSAFDIVVVVKIHF